MIYELIVWLAGGILVAWVTTHWDRVRLMTQPRHKREWRAQEAWVNRYLAKEASTLEVLNPEWDPNVCEARAQDHLRRQWRTALVLAREEGVA